MGKSEHVECTRDTEKLVVSLIEAIKQVQLAYDNANKDEFIRSTIAVCELPPSVFDFDKDYDEAVELYNYVHNTLSYINSMNS